MSTNVGTLEAALVLRDKMSVVALQLNKTLKMTESAIKSLEAPLDSAAKAQERAAAATKKLDSSISTTQGKYGQMADVIGRTSTTLARSADAFGLPVGPLRMLDDVMDVAELGLGNLTKGAAGFNMASVGMVGAGLAIGVALGNLANKFEFVRNAADKALAPIAKLLAYMRGEAGAVTQLEAQADFQARIAEKHAEAAAKQVAQLKAQGIAVGDIAKQYENLNPKLKEQLGLTEKQVEAAKKAQAAAKAAADEQQRLMDQLSGATAERELQKLIAAWGKLSAKQKEDSATVVRLFEAYKKLRGEVGPGKLPEDLEQIYRALEKTGVSLEQVSGDFGELGEEVDYVGPLLRKMEADLKKQADAAEEAARKMEEMREATYSLGESLGRIGERVGGSTGQMVSAFGSVLKLMVNLEASTKKNITAMEALSAAAAGFAAGMESSSWWQGAISGALSGASSGGVWGAVIGGLSGALGGLLNGQKEAEAAAQQLAERLDQLRDSVQLLAESMDLAVTDVDRLGQSMINSWTGSESDLKALQDQLKEMRKNLKAIEEATKALADRTQKWWENLRKTGEATAQTQEEFDRLGRYALAALEGMIRNGASLLDVMSQLGPVLQALQNAMREFGLKASESLARMIQLYNVIQNNQTTVDAIQALLLIMKGLGDAAGATALLFNDFFADAIDLFEKLKKGGADDAQALLLLQPILQRLWEMAKLFGYQLTKEQENLLKKAEEAGLVGENFRDVNERILKVLTEGLGTLIKLIGLNLVNAWGDATEAVKAYKKQQNSTDTPGGPPGTPPTDTDDDSDQSQNPNAPPKARGGITSGTVLPFLPRAANGLIVPDTPGGKPFIAGEGGKPELIAPIEDLARAIGQSAAAAGGPQTIVIRNELDGRVYSENVFRRERAGLYRRVK